MPDRTYTEQEVGRAAGASRRAPGANRSARRERARPYPHRTRNRCCRSRSGSAPAPAGGARVRRPQTSVGGPRPSARPLPTSRLERRVPGTLTPEAWEDVVAELRHRFDTDLGAMWGMPHYGASTTRADRAYIGVEAHQPLRHRDAGADPPARGAAARPGQPARGVGESAGRSVYLQPDARHARRIGRRRAGRGGGGPWSPCSFRSSSPCRLIVVADQAWRRKKHRKLEELTDYVAELVAGPTRGRRRPRRGRPRRRPYTGPRSVAAGAR